MSKSTLSKNSLEVLEARIAPAAATPILPTSDGSYVKATLGAPVEVKAGQVLSTTGGKDGGYFLYVEQGNALVFFTDLNNNRQVDFNELTGISAGDGLRLTCFTDIHGDIVTNLRETTATFDGTNGPIVKTLLTLSDSDNNPSNDSLSTKGDGRVLLNKTIEKIEMRTVQIADIPDQDGDGDVDDADVALRRLPTTFSIFGNIFAGKGFGAEDGGLIIDSTAGVNLGFEVHPTVGAIKTGTAVSGEYFSFGVSSKDDISGNIIRFTPPRGQAGGDIVGVKAFDETMTFNIDGLAAGDGGFGARGGDIKNVILRGDDTSGYYVTAGNGGGGLNGGAGGSILNFSDLGSSTGRVAIKSGTGGTGATGAGGAGGIFSFENFSVRGDVSLELGDGGDGFTAGGNGASLAKGEFSQPDGSEYLRGNGYGSTHLPSTAKWQDAQGYTPVLGTHEAVDFDGDGNGDFVYTTRTTSQLVVMYGNGLGGFRFTTDASGFFVIDKTYLEGVRNPEALTVGDFNGDGHPDIAVASLDQDSHAGVVVFLAKYEHEGAGTLTGSEDLNKNNINDFLGFRGPRFSTLPDLQGLGAPYQISSIAAGDFNGDGKPELAVISTFYDRRTVDENGTITGVSVPYQVLTFMVADTEVDNITGQTNLTGQFYVDVVNGVPATILTNNNVGPESVVMEATALSTTATNDVVLVGVKGSHTISAISYVGNTSSNVGTFELGQVDTNRRTGADNITLTDFPLKDFTVLDYTGDGNADVLAVSSGITFVVGSKGSGTGTGTPDSGTGDQAGNFLNPQAGYETFHAVKSLDSNNDGKIDDVGIYLTRDGRARVEMFKVASGSDAIAFQTSYILTPLSGGNDEVLFDLHYRTVGTPQTPQGVPDIAIAHPSLGFIDFVNPTTAGLVSSVSLASVGLKISAGDGGNASVGSGGKGGSLGGGATIQNITDPLTGLVQKDLVGSLNLNLVGTLRVVGGTGGDGFANGGAGGDVSGVVLRARGDAFVQAYAESGSGGRGVTGKGGAGGDIKQSSFEAFSRGDADAQPVIDPVTLVAGSGGAGSTGGNGGSILGNESIVADAFVSSYRVTAGDGGAGTKKGGNGGSILNLAPLFQVPQAVDGVSEDGIGFLAYQAGAGGNSVGGRGGDGGSIVNSAPRDNAYLSANLTLTAGDAGAGTVGGNGGSIKQFELSLLGESRLPLVFAAVAGHGGAGFAGSGGSGGSVSNISASSRALTESSRVLAGTGGASAAAAGGNGGSISSVIGTVTDGAFAIVAGAGGAGLTKGGHGGNLNQSTINVGAGASAKVLGIAGAGGDASAFIDSDPARSVFAFGGKVGVGGGGGDINGFYQKGSTGSHADLIAGNGGSTVNYGTVFDTKSYVGQGGSIMHVNLNSGDIGNVAIDLASTPDVDENVPIKSYNNIFAGETIVDFVETKLRPGGSTLTDADGNVGIVVGAAGRNKAIQLADGSFQTQPSTSAVNGSLIDVSAKNLMSAVAGSVDRIAAIQATIGLKIPAGIIGADKGSFINPGIDPTPPDATGDNKGNGTVNVADYLLTDANTPTATGGPVLDGALVDGALVTKVLLNDKREPISLQGRVFTTKQPGT